jgi:hypothetical protein
MVKTAVVLPQWFGAKADGMHDDTRAIQQAADLAQFSSGKLLRLNPGSYVFSDSINIRCNVDCRGTLLQRLEVDHEKTKHSNFTYVPSHFVRKVFRVSIVPDQPALRLKSEPFLGLKAGDFKLPLAGKVELEDGSGTVELQEGGSIRFFSTDFFSSRHNQYGDEWYDKTEISMLVSGRGDFYPELMYSYLPPPEAAEWNEQQQYKKGDYCSHEGKLYKAVWASGPGATFKHNFKGLVQLGPSKPRPGTTSYPMTFDDGIEDNIRTWREVYTQVYYQPPQAALRIDGLSIEVSVVGSDTEKLRLNSGSALSVSRSNTTLNNLKVFCSSPNATLSALISNWGACKVTYNNAYVSGATYHGLGYNLTNSTCSLLRFNNCVSVNCRDAIAGRCNKDVVIDGGFFNRIDDHYGMNYTIRNVKINAYSTYIPGYCSPKASFEDWGFAPTAAMAFSGGNFYVENCHIYNASTIFSSRGDIGDFYGTVTLKNIVVDSDLDVSLLTVSVSPDFDYAHDVRLPSQVTIQNVRNQGKGSLGIYGRFDQSSPHGGFQTLLRDVGPLKSVTWPGAVQFESCIFEQAKFNVKDATFRFCEFRGESSGLEQASPQSLLNINAPFAAP